MKQIYTLGTALCFALSVLSQSCIQTATINIDSNQVKTLQTNPVQLLPAAPANHYWQILSIESESRTNGNPNKVMVYTYLDNPSFPSWYSLILYDSFDLFQRVTESLNDYNLLEGAALFLTAESNSTGNTALKMLITYREVSMTGVTSCEPDTVFNPTSPTGTCTDIVHVSSSEILTLNTFPKIVIPAPVPAGKYINVITCQVRMYGGTPYTTHTRLLLYYGDSTQFIGAQLSALQANDTILYTFPVNGGVGTILSNAPLKLTVEGGNPTGGTGSLDLIIKWELSDIENPFCSSCEVGSNVLDSITDLTSDTVSLSLNKTNIITAAGTVVNATFDLPAGQDNDIISIVLTQVCLNVMFIGAGTSTITPIRLGQLLTQREMTLRCVNGNYY